MDRVSVRIALAFAFGMGAWAAAHAQVTYCRQFDNKTYCSGGVIVHQFGNTTIIPNPTPMAPRQPAFPSLLLNNNDLPTLNAPYSAAGTQGSLPPAYVAPPIAPAPQSGPVLVLPPTGSRVCHQFGTVLVCN